MTQEQEPSSAGSAAQAYFEHGYYCAPSVLMAFAGRCDLPLDVAARLATPYGAGIASTGQTCGAVSGALMAIGLQAASADPNDAEARERTFSLTRRFMRQFAERHGSIVCQTLLDGCNVGTPEGSRRASELGFFTTRCPVYVHDAAEIVESILK